MFDIETLGQGSYSQITSIAAVQFDIASGRTFETFNEHVNISEKTDYGFKFEPSTVLWWLNQSKEAQNNFLNGQKNSKDIHRVLTLLNKFFFAIHDKSLIRKSNIYVWGRGPRFDMGILTNAYEKMNMPAPWDFRNERCVRTMEWLLPEAKTDTPKVDNVGHGESGGGSHDALLDAKYQIAYVSKIYNQLNLPLYSNAVSS